MLIPATITDPLNRFVLGLRKEDFRVFEDGTEQTIAHFSGEDAPLSLGLVFDCSGSMDDKLRFSRLAAAQFLKTMNVQDEAFLVEFNDSAQLRWSLLAILSSFKISWRRCNQAASPPCWTLPRWHCVR